jgi:hypothetical protein
VRHAKLPLNPDAVKEADEELYKNHPELGWRKLTMSPEDGTLRKEWMDSYLRAGGEVEDPKAPAPPACPTTPCPAAPEALPANWINDILAIFCPKDKAFLDALRARGVVITGFKRIYFDDPYYDGTKWTTKHFEAGGTTSDNHINMIVDDDPNENAATIFHEGVHTGQPEDMAWRDKEYQAYTEEDKWRISHGLPPHDPSFRTTDSAGNPVTNEAGVRDYVDKNYPGVTSKPSSDDSTPPPDDTPEQVIGRTDDGKTIVQKSDGTTYTRAPREGDSFSGDQVTEPPGGQDIPTSALTCP